MSFNASHLFYGSMTAAGAVLAVVGLSQFVFIPFLRTGVGDTLIRNVVVPMIGG
jgi:type III secretory pathway component EscT